jgi:mannose-6-phosphate isomerase
MNLEPVRLLPSFREKLWGSTELEPWFRDTESKIGEVWFTADDNMTEDGRRLSELVGEPAIVGTAWEGSWFPILVKFLFTTDRLSVQVHPDDERGFSWEGSPGKTEMWHILRAGQNASIALGFTQLLSPAQLRSAAVSGEIEKRLRWWTVSPGQSFLVPSGTVHAIGANLALVEIQQNSDITYRLYDYERPRPLHLDKGVAVSIPAPHPGPSRISDLGGGRKLLTCCDHFATELVMLSSPAEYRAVPEHLDLLVFISGSGEIAGRSFSAGECWLVPAMAPVFTIRPQRTVRYLKTFVP